MLNWIKKYGSWLIGIVITVLCSLLGIERFRRKRAEKKKEEAEGKAATAVIEQKAEEDAKESVVNVVEEFNEVDKKTEEVKEQVNEGKTDYNDIVDMFNSWDYLM